MDYSTSNIDKNNFRNGPSVHLKDWMDIKVRRISFRKPAFLVLSGEALSIHPKEGAPPFARFNLRGTVISFRKWRFARRFKIALPDRVFYCTVRTHEEMKTWTENLKYARERAFEDHYNLLLKIGVGRLSNVYFAHPMEDPSQLVAVKVVNKEGLPYQTHEMLRRERYINSVVNHPNIVRALDMFSTVEEERMVFEIMRGGNLRSLLRRHGKLPESYARVVMAQLSSALVYLHNKNVVHRDVRPANIFCSDVRFPLSIALGDFGSVAFSPHDRVNQSVQTQLIGVVPYISIDICRGAPYGPVSDMWSAGVVLYEILSGDSPFPGKCMDETLERIKKGEFEFYGEAWTRVGEEAKSLVRQLLQPDPFKRLSALAVNEHAWMLKDRSSGRIPGFRDEIGSLSGSSLTPSSSGKTWVSSSLGRSGSVRSSSRSESSSYSNSNVQPILPSVKAAERDGFPKTNSVGSSRFESLLESRVFQSQLNTNLPYRRKFVTICKAFIAVFRMKRLMRRECVTKMLPGMDLEEATRLSKSLDEPREKRMENKTV